MAVNGIVEVIIDLISNMANNDPIHVCVDELLLTVVRGFKCLL